MRLDHQIGQRKQRIGDLGAPVAGWYRRLLAGFDRECRMEREQRRRFREIRRRRGQNVNLAPEVRAAWQRCRDLSLAYLDALIAAHASGCAGRGRGLRPLRPSRPRRAGGAPEPRPPRLGPPHGGHAVVPRAAPAATRGSPRSRRRSSRPGASTPSTAGSRGKRPTARASTSSARASTRRAPWPSASTTRTSSPCSPTAAWTFPAARSRSCCRPRRPASSATTSASSTACRGSRSRPA